MDNYEASLTKMQEQFSILQKLICGEWQGLQIHQAEENLFRHLLEIGRTALIAYAEKKGTGKEYFGESLTSHKMENWNYISIFGTIPIPRAYFWEKGMEGGGICPIDKEHNLPDKHYSYLLHQWSQMIAVDSNYDAARENLFTILGINIWSKQSEEMNRKAAGDVAKYYDEKPTQQQQEPILVAEIDGKGVVMRKEKQDKEKRVRLKKGEKNGIKKMATVTAVFGIDRNVRAVEDIIRTETAGVNGKKAGKISVSAPEMYMPCDDGPTPQNKHLRATLHGKDLAFERLVKEIDRRDPEKKCERIALVDGERGLESKIKEILLGRGFILVLDLYHVMERLWALCYYFCAEGSVEATLWVRKYLKMILEGKTGYFIGAIRQIISKGDFCKSKRAAIEKMLEYYERRKEYMCYDLCLSKGYPIGSGVIEGACRSFVKDRMELSGMRWSEEGAEAMLELRSIKVNGYWADYWQYFIGKEQKRIYGRIDTFFQKHKENVERAA